LWNLGVIARAQGEYARSVTLLEESLSLNRQAGDRWGIARALEEVASSELALGHAARAACLADESLAQRRAMGEKIDLGISLHGRFRVACHQGDYVLASALLGECLALFQD